MKAENISAIAADPIPPDWASVELAPTWADELKLSTPTGLWRFLRSLFGPRQRVVVDDQLPAHADIPRYALQEFHNLPNGNYSCQVSRGYITGFDIAMLGVMQRQRQQMATRVADCHSVLELGTGGGKLARAVRDVGVTDVWGVDVSPYLLKHAAVDHPSVKFLQAPAEALPFSDERFDAVLVCFLFHEMPPKYIQQALQQCYRVLKPGGKLLVSEPSPNQLQAVRWRSLLRFSGWKHLYYKTLANFVFEPFLAAWHRQDKPSLFSAAGFIVQEHNNQLPINFYALEKPGA